MRRIATAVAATFLMALPAVADEMWKTDYGPVIWEKDFEGGAILKLDLDDGEVVRFYVEGLGIDSTPRGMFKGYWISTGEEDECSAQLRGPDGTRSNTWGRMSLIFSSPDFPSDWVMLTGDCHDEPDSLVVGTVDTGE